MVIFEDIDSFANSRKEGINPELADFLQLLSGVSDSNNHIIFIATTNFIDLLDKAVSNRPMRFNRKFEFAYPKEKEVDQLIDLYFGKETIPVAHKEMCYNCKFTGSHIKEIFRTATLEGLKNKKALSDNFTDALAIVKKNFNSPNNEVVGFGRKK